jgi:hypothetical protein
MSDVHVSHRHGRTDDLDIWQFRLPKSANHAISGEGSSDTEALVEICDSQVRAAVNNNIKELQVQSSE